MTQSFDFRLNGESINIVSGELSRTADTACDGCVVSFPIDPKTQRDLYEASRPRSYAKIQVYIDGDLYLTGKKTKVVPVFSNSGRSYSLHGWSNTFNFVDSALKPPYERKRITFNNLVREVAKQTATNISVESTDTDIITPDPVIQHGQTGFSFCQPIADQYDRILSCDEYGSLVIKQANAKSESIGVIEEGSDTNFFSNEFAAEYDDRKAFRAYKVRSETPAGRAEGTTIDDSVPEPRLKLVNVDNKISGGIPEVAEWQKHVDLIEQFTQEIPVTSWTAPDGEKWKPDTIFTLVSESLFIPDGFDFYIRAVKYNFSSSGKTAVLSCIPPNVYTKEPLILPWLEPSANDRVNDFLSRFDIS